MEPRPSDRMQEKGIGDEIRLERLDVQLWCPLPRIPGRVSALAAVQEPRLQVSLG